MNFKKKRIFSFWLVIFFVVLLTNFGTCLQDTENWGKSGQAPPLSIVASYSQGKNTDGQFSEHKNFLPKERNLLEAKNENIQAQSNNDENDSKKGIYIGVGVLAILLIILILIISCCCCSCCKSSSKKKQKALRKALKDSEKMKPQDILVLHPAKNDKPMELNVDLNLEPTLNPSSFVSKNSFTHEVEVYPRNDKDAVYIAYENPNETALQDELAHIVVNRKSSFEKYENMKRERSAEFNDRDSMRPMHRDNTRDSKNTKSEPISNIKLNHHQDLKNKDRDQYDVKDYSKRSSEQIPLPVKQPNIKRGESLEKSTGYYKNNPYNDSFIYNYVVEELKENPNFMPKYQTDRKLDEERIDSDYSKHIVDSTNNTEKLNTDENDVKSASERPKVMPKPIKREDSNRNANMQSGANATEFDKSVKEKKLTSYDEKTSNFYNTKPSSNTDKSEITRSIYKNEEFHKAGSKYDSFTKADIRKPQRYDSFESGQPSLKNEPLNTISHQRYSIEKEASQRYVSPEREANLQFQKQRRFSSEREAYNQSRHKDSFERERYYQKHRYNSPERRSNNQIKGQRRNSFDSQPQKRRHGSFEEEKHLQKHKHNYSDRDPYYQAKTNYDKHVESYADKKMTSRKKIENKDIYDENYSKSKQGIPYDVTKSSSVTEDLTKENVPTDWMIKENRKSKPNPKIDDNISIPDPDYINPTTKEFDENEYFNIDNRPPIPPKPQTKIRDFKRPYGLEDLDEMNNPLTLAWRNKSQKAPIDFGNPQ